VFDADQFDYTILDGDDLGTSGSATRALRPRRGRQLMASDAMKANIWGRA
jgi:hypothetical protein